MATPKEILDYCLTELRKHWITREQEEYEMGKLNLAARGVLNLIDDKAEREGYKTVLDRYRVRTGLIDLVILSLTMSDRPLTPSEIRTFIVNYGSEASTQQNLLQSVHTTLKRLEGERIKEVTLDGEKAYRLMGIGERILRTVKGIDPADANRVGKRIETRYTISKDDPLYALCQPASQAERVADEDEGIPERWKMTRWKK